MLLYVRSVKKEKEASKMVGSLYHQWREILIVYNWVVERNSVVKPIPMNWFVVLNRRI